ncbi:MAG: hypothetical protein JWQ35_1553 [Bacteriovoracaceae bacterium]|nr:hypothetical protein [Bacteriovoracaceae bacterium]
MNWRLLILIIFLVTFYFLFFRPKTEKEVARDLPLAKSEVVETKLPSKEISSPQKLNPPPQEKSQILPKESESVYFEKDGKWAVFFEDIILGEIKDSDEKKNGFAEAPKVQLWNNPIPYAIDKDVPSPERIERAIQYFNQHTPIKFVSFSGESDAIFFRASRQILPISSRAKRRNSAGVFIFSLWDERNSP